MSDVEMTALEQKWKESAENKAPELEDAYDEEGNFRPEDLEQSVLDRIPTPTGWRIAILPYRGPEKTKGGIVLSDETQRRTQLATICGYVLKLGDLAYKDDAKFPTGPWCKEGDFVLVRTYSGTRFKIFGKEFRLLNDDQVDAVVQDPRGLTRA